MSFSAQLSQLRRLTVVLVLTGAALSAPVSAEAQTFQQPQVVPTPQSPYSTATIWATTFTVGDLDGDGRPDIFYQFTGVGGAYNGYVLSSPLFNLGNRQFLPPGGGTGTASVAGSSIISAITTLKTGGQPFQVTVQAAGSYTAVDIVGYTVNRVVGGVGNTSSIFSHSGSKPAVLSYLSVVDVNGDGYKDVVVEDAANGYLYILLNDGNNNFKLKSSIQLSATDGPGPILTGNFHNSGHLDILVNNQTTHIVTPYFGNGDGTFATAAPLTLSGGIFSMVAYPVVVANSSTEVAVEGVNGALFEFAGSSLGIQNSALPLAGAQNGLTGNGGHLVAIANLDGHEDIITATPAGISVLLGQTDGSYKLGGIYNAGPGHTSYAVADFDSDGHLDLAVDSPEGVAILYGNPDGSFQTSRAYAAGQPALSGALGRFFTPGVVDTVVATAAFQGQVLQGKGDGTFTYLGSPNAPVPTTTVASPAGLWSQVLTGDFNRDGLDDLLFTEDGPAATVSALPSGDGGIRSQTATGNGTFGAPTYIGANQANSGCPHTVTYYLGRSVIADFDSDGIPDFANRDISETRINLTDPSSSHPVGIVSGRVDDTACTPHAHQQLVAGDFDHDGLLDLVVQADGHLSLYLNQGPSANALLAGALGDLSLDGSLTTRGQLIAPALSSTFGGTVDTSAGGLGFPAAIGSMAVADLDHDGNLDLIVAYHNMAADPTAPAAANPNYLYLWYGSGGGKFLTSAKHPVNPVRLTPSRNFYQVTVADVDGDGVPDLILSDGYVVSIQSGKGDGSFGPEVHYLAGQGINSVTAGDLTGRTKQSLIIANGGAVLSNPVANKEVLATNPDVNTGGVTVLLNQQTLGTPTGTVVANPEPSVYGSNFNLVATLNTAAATGTVTFSIDGTVVGTAAVVNGAATYTYVAPVFPGINPPPGILVGTHSLTAVYSGDGTYATATFTGSHTVIGLPSYAQITGLQSPIPYGLIIGDNAVAAVGVQPNAQEPTGGAVVGGTITIYIDGVNTCVLAANIAGTCPATTGAGYDTLPNPHTVTNVFSGDQENAPSTSQTYYVVVIPDDTTTNNLASSKNPSVFGTSVTLTAQVIAPYATPNGPLAFYDGNTLIGTATLNAQGIGSISVSTLSIGTHTITAKYAATLDFNASVSTTIAQIVTQPPASPVATITLLASSINPSVLSQAVTFSAAVATTGAFVIIPTGSVSFYDATTLLGTATLDAKGNALFTTSTLMLGKHNITASYAGNTTTAASASATLVQVVNQALTLEGNGFLLQVTPTAISAGIGAGTSVSVQIVPLNNFNQSVTLACANLPAETTCAFDTTVIPAGGGTTRLTITPAAPHNCGSNVPYFIVSTPTAKWPWLAVIGIALLAARRRRKVFRAIVLLAALCVLPAINGCGTGNCTDFGVKPGNYSFVVSGTSNGTPVYTQAVTMQMNAHL